MVEIESQDSIPQNRWRTVLLSLFQIVLIVFACAYLTFVAIASDYNEAGILLFGILIGTFSLALFWKTHRKILKLSLCLILVAAIFFSGILFIRAGKYRQQVNVIVACNMLYSVGRALEAYRNQAGELPDCKWVCMGKTITDTGHWKGLTIPYEDTDQELAFETIPMKDGWGCRYSYENMGAGRFVLKSSGADRRFFTLDDLIYISDTLIALPMEPVPVFPRKGGR